MFVNNSAIFSATEKNCQLPHKTRHKSRRDAPSKLIKPKIMIKSNFQTQRNSWKFKIEINRESTWLTYQKLEESPNQINNRGKFQTKLLMFNKYLKSSQDWKDWSYLRITYLTTTSWLPDCHWQCQATGWWQPDEAMTTAWRSDVSLSKACSLHFNCLKKYLMTAWNNCQATA